MLKITTVHLLGIWWYPFGRESIVIAREPDWRWLAVGHPSLRYARILSREPALSDASLKTAVAALAGRFRLVRVCIDAADGRQKRCRAAV